MRRQSQKILLIVLVVVLLTLAVIKIREFTLLIGMPVETNPTQDPLKADLLSLVSQYKSGDVSVIDISTLTTFPWDQLYIFGPYTDPSELDVMVGTSWRNNCVTQIENSDGITLLVFSNDGIVVHCLDYPRGENHFFVPVQGYESGFSPQEAIFILDEQGRIVPIKK
jgi:hypothetical protein